VSRQSINERLRGRRVVSPELALRLGPLSGNAAQSLELGAEAALVETKLLLAQFTLAPDPIAETRHRATPWLHQYLPKPLLDHPADRDLVEEPLPGPDVARQARRQVTLSRRLRLSRSAAKALTFGCARTTKRRETCFRKRSYGSSPGRTSDDVVTFELDGEGHVTGLTIHPGGRAIPAKQVRQLGDYRARPDSRLEQLPAALPRYPQCGEGDNERIPESRRPPAGCSGVCDGSSNTLSASILLQHTTNWRRRQAH